MGSVGASTASVQTQSPRRRVRLHRALLQPEQTAFNTGISKPHGVRGTSYDSLIRCPRNQQKTIQLNQNVRRARLLRILSLRRQTHRIDDRPVDACPFGGAAIASTGRPHKLQPGALVS